MGKSSKSFSRIFELNKYYDFVLNRGLIFFADRANIFHIETELKNTLPKCMHVYGKVDGSNEIREFKYFWKANEILRGKSLTEYSLNEISNGNDIKHPNLVNSITSVYKNLIIRKIDRKGNFWFNEYVLLYAFNYIDYYFDDNGYLNLIFIRDYDDSFELISDKYIDYYTYKKDGETFTKFRIMNDFDENLKDELYKTLCINPTHDEKLEAIEKKQNSLNILKEQCSSDYPICFKDFVNNELVYLPPSLIFKDLNFIRTSDIEDNFSLCYNSQITKRIFYRDAINYYLSDEKENRDYYDIERFNQASLLAQKHLIINDEKDDDYFWECAKYYGKVKKPKRLRNNSYGNKLVS